MTPLRLASDEVHCWTVRLDVASEESARLFATLTSDERSRCARLRFERDQRRFIVAHGVLREILGRYLGTDPGQLRFISNAFGKPALSPEFGSRLKFNLSHSADLALIAVTADADIGVDVENIQPQSDYIEIARCFFSAAEVDHLNTLPSYLRAQAFFSHWTKKEAYVKARGEGLSLLSADGLDERWSLHTLQPARGYIGALAVEGQGRRVLERSHPTFLPCSRNTVEPGRRRFCDPGKTLKST
jgi:4'-phosphopantetheinyl transferase